MSSSSSSHHDDLEEQSQHTSVAPQHPTSPSRNGRRRRPSTRGGEGLGLNKATDVKPNGSAAAGNSTVRGANGSSYSKPKRRRIDAGLGFSSPGPAFMLSSTSLGDDGSSSGTDSTGASRSRRARRSLVQRTDDNTPTTSPKPTSLLGRSATSSIITSKARGSSTYAQEDLSTASASDLETNNPASSSVDEPSKPTRNVSKSSESVRTASAETELEGMPLLPARRPLPTITPVVSLTGQMSFPEILAKRKEETLKRSQAELEDVHEDHDMMVRELFHLTKFVTLIGYDPLVAKEDRSDVFSQFQQIHDLRFALDANGAGPSGSNGRITRRGMNARLEGLALKRLQPPPPASSTPKSANKDSRLRRSASAAKEEATTGSEKGKRRAAGVEHEGGRSGSKSIANGKIVDMSDSPSVAKLKRGGPRRKSAAWNLELQATKRPRPLPDVPPPLRVMGPQHVPVRSRHSSQSLAQFWDSFRLLGDEELSLPKAAEVEASELEKHLRVDRKKRKGFALSEGLSKVARQIPHATPRKKDHRDHLLEAMVSASQQMRHLGKQRIQVPKKIAKMVAVYWDRQVGSSERERRAEEKRLRVLAKWTVREVGKQWKLAINVVRARKLAVEKAQKDKLDKQQLNAILEKSTQMLQQQHAEMSRMEDDTESEKSFYSEDEDMSAAEEDEDEDDDLEPDGEDQEPSIDADSAAKQDDFLTDEDEGAKLVELLDEDEPDPPSPAKAEPGQTIDEEIASPSPEAVPDTPPADEEFNTLAQSPSHQSASPHVKTPPIKAMKLPGDHTSPAPAFHADNPATHSELSKRPSCTGSGRISSQRAIEVPDPDADDDEFAAEDDNEAVEDAELEKKMWEEDEEDDSEDEGLAADADVPIEELLRHYGYDGGTAKGGAEASDPGEEESNPSASGKPTPSVQSTPAPDEDQDDGAKAPDSDDATDQVSTGEEDSEAESMIEPRRKNSRRSLTRASSAMSSDGNAARSRQPFLLRGLLRPYQQIGFEWLAGLYANGVNGILADEMGLGKTIQTISLLAHLACDKGVWGPHLVVAPTSVMLNWEVEFKKFLPGFKILSYYGNQRERKEKRIGWNTENSFNVCITSYQLVLADQHIFRRKPWVYLILDEAHHIKNFRSQRWQTLLGFNSQHRLLLTGTPLQNNLMDLWSLMYFLMPHGVADIPGGGAFANMKDFQDWFSNPLDKAIESGTNMDEEMRAMISKLHTVLRPYLLRRLKAEVEKELPQKYEHVITCRLSKRQRFLYNDFMSRAKTRESLASGNYLSIINCLMQLRKVCNHPDLFEVRPIVTSFAMQRSVVADYEIKELLVRRQLLRDDPAVKVDFDALNLNITSREEHLTPIFTRDTRRLNASKKLPYFNDVTPSIPLLDTSTIEGFKKTLAQRRRAEEMAKCKHLAYVNQFRCTRRPVYGKGPISLIRKLGESSRLLPAELLESDRRGYLNRCDNAHKLVKSLPSRCEAMQVVVDKFAFATPRAVAVDMPRWALSGFEPAQCPQVLDESFDTLHPVAVKLHIAFPDASLLQYDCGKLQQLDLLMRRLKEGGHRILIFTQMTRVLDILEAFLNYHGYRYLRLDGATKVEQRQALTEKFNRDLRISAFILSTRSGGLGINLTGADTVLFYDLDWNAAIEAQCMDRAHRIGQTRDVHIYRFVSEHTIEENMLRKANQKRLLDNVVIQAGEFNTDQLLKNDWRDMLDEGGATLAGVQVGEANAVGGRDVEKALLEAEDEEDRNAAKAAREEMVVDETDFANENVTPQEPMAAAEEEQAADEEEEKEEAEEEQGGSIDDYMLRFIEADWDFFA